MLIFRWLLLLLLFGALICFGLYIGTGHKGWLRWGVTIVKWTVIAALGFFGVLVLERMAIAL
jgi:hypothetical protein